jgi:predicted CoA-binding protein
VALPPHVVDLLESKDTTRIALVGASNNPRKYGHIILNDLVQKGFTILPVNPNASDVAGLDAHARVADLEDPVHIVNFVVPPDVARDVLDGLDEKRFHVVWFQPGAFDRDLVKAAEARFRYVVAGDCIMVET